MHSSPRPAKDLPPLPPASPSTFATTTAAEAAAAPSPGPRPPLPPRRTPSSSEESASILSSAVDWPLPYEQPTTAAMASTAPLPPPIDATPGTTSTTPSMVRAYDPHFDPNMQSDGEDLDVTAAMHLPIIDALLTRKLPTLPSADSSSSLSTVGTAQPATLLPPIPGSPLVPASATAPAADLELDLAAEVEALLHVADDVGAEDGEVVHPIGMVTEDDNGPQEDPEAVAVATAMLDHTLGRRHTLRRERSVRRAAGSVGGGGGGRPASAVTLTSPPAPSAVVLGDSPSPPSPFVSASPPTPAATTEKATIPTLASIASSSHATDSLASLSPGALTTADRQAPPAEGRVLSEYERGHSPVVHAAPLADDSPRQHQQHERAESSSGMAVMAAMSVGAGLGGGDDMYQRALNLLEMKRIAVLGDVDATVSPTKQSTYAPASMGGGEAYYGEYNNNDDDQQEMTVEFAPAGGPTDLESPPLQYSSLGADGAPAAVASAPAADHVDGVHKVHNQDLATTPETPVVVAGSDRSIVSSLIPPAPSKTPDIDDSQRVMFMQAIDVLRMLTSPTAQPSSQSQLEQQFGAPQSAIQPAAAEPQYAVTSAPTAAVPTSFDNLPSLPEAPPVTNAAADAEAAVASLPEIPEAPPVLSSHEDLVVVPVAEDQPAVAVPIHEFTDLPDDGEEMMLPMSSSSPNAATPVAAVAKPAMMNPTSPTDTALGAADATSIAAAAQPLPEMRAFRPVVVSQAPIGAQKTGGDALLTSPITAPVMPAIAQDDVGHPPRVASRMSVTDSSLPAEGAQPPHQQQQQQQPQHMQPQPQRHTSMYGAMPGQQQQQPMPRPVIMQAGGRPHGGGGAPMRVMTAPATPGGSSLPPGVRPIMVVRPGQAPTPVGYAPAPQGAPGTPQMMYQNGQPMFVRPVYVRPMMTPQGVVMVQGSSPVYANGSPMGGPAPGPPMPQPQMQPPPAAQLTALASDDGGPVIIRFAKSREEREAEEAAKRQQQAAMEQQRAAAMAAARAGSMYSAPMGYQPGMSPQQQARPVMYGGPRPMGASPQHSRPMSIMLGLGGQPMMVPMGGGPAAGGVGGMRPIAFTPQGQPIYPAQPQQQAQYHQQYQMMTPQATGQMSMMSPQATGHMSMVGGAHPGPSGSRPTTPGLSPGLSPGMSPTQASMTPPMPAVSPGQMAAQGMPVPPGTMPYGYHPGYAQQQQLQQQQYAHQQQYGQQQRPQYAPQYAQQQHPQYPQAPPQPPQAATPGGGGVQRSSTVGSHVSAMSAGAQSVGGQSVATAAATVAEPAPAPAAPAPPAVVYVTAADVDAKRESVSKTDPAGQTEFAKWLLREAARLPDAPSSHDLKHKMFDEAMAGVRRQAEGYGSGAARNGWPEAQFFLAECYRKGAFGTSKNLDKAYALYTKASKAGHSPATYYRGLCCELGHGTKVNETKALTMFRTAAQAGVTAAALKLGVIYQRGLLRQKPNEANALLWLKRAAADVNTAAQVVAATEAGETGGDEAATPEAASRMAAMASRNVYALHACWLLGLHYEKGRAGDDHEKGFQFFLDAAELGYAPAMFKVGMCLRDGVGIDRNPAEATEWFAAAAAAGVGSLGEITNLPLPV